MAYSNALSVSIMCTDKQDLVSVKFCWNGYEFWKIFAADSFVFALLFTFYCSIVDSAWQKCTCITVCDVTILITCMWSVCFLFRTGRILKWTYTYWKSWAVSSSCQALVILTEDSAAPDSKSSRIVVLRLEEIFCIMEESMVSVLCLCVHKNKTSSVNTRKIN